MRRETLRFGVVGLGEFGDVYLACLHSLKDVLDIQTTAVCSRSSERAQQVAERYGVARWYTDAQELASDPDVDVVCVVTAEHEHFSPVMAALSAGKDVIVEKPLSTNLSEAQAMVDAARRSGRQLLTGHILRFESMYRRLHQQVRAGELGKPVSIHTRRNRPGELVARYRARTHPVLETGVLDIDVMLWLTQSNVERVTGVTRTVVPGQNPDLVWGILEFADGCVGVLETSWLGPASGIFTDDCISVIGTSGTARLDLSRAPLALWNASGFVVPDTMYSPILGDEVHGAFREQIMTFVSALRLGHGADLVPLGDVLHGLTVASALIRSSEEGKAVEIDAFRPN